MAVIAIAELQIDPVFTGIHDKMRREVGKTMPKAGRDAGQALGKGMADGFSAETSGLEAEVSRLSQSVAKANSNLEASKKKVTEASAAESKALGDLRVAELKLQETRDNSAAKASQLAAAEERVETIRYRVAQATERRVTADTSLAKATAHMASEQDRASQATSKLEGHLRRVEEETTRTERSTTRLASAMRGAFSRSPLAGLVLGVKSDTDRVQYDMHKMAQNVSNQGTRGGRAFTQGFILAIGGLSAITPAVGGVGAALVAAAGAATTLGGSLSALGGISALIPAGLMAIGASAGVLVAAFRGIGEAMKTATDAQGKFTADSRLQAMAVADAGRAITQAEQNVARAAEDGARRVEDAKRNVVDAVRAAAEAEEAAADSIEAATRRVVDAKRNHADAVRAVADAEASAAESVERSNRRVRDAKFSLQDAVERVAEAQVQAARAVEQAERRQAEATQAVTDAQNALVKAREDAQARVSEVSGKSGAAERKAVDTTLALARAQEALSKAKADPKADALRLAQLEHNVTKAAAADEAAKQAIIDLRTEYASATEEAKRGNDAVLAAEKKLADARQAEADAIQARADAEAKVIKQQRDGARDIERAQEAVADALKEQKRAHEDNGRAAEEAARRVLDAQQGVTDAVEAEKDARQDAGRVAEENARRVADAQRAVKDATRDSSEAQAAAVAGLEQAHRNLERVQIQQADAAKKLGHDASEAMGNLSPAAQTATRAMLGLYDQLGKIRMLIQENFFAGFTAPLMALSATVLPQLAVGTGAIATAFGQSAQIFMGALDNAFGNGVLQGLLLGVADMVTVLNNAITPLVDAFVTLGVVGMEYMPRMAQWFVDMANQFDAFVQRIAASGELDAYIEAGIQGWKDVGSIIGSVVGIFGALNDAAEAGGAAATLGGLASGLRDIESAMQGATFQTTMATIFEGAAAGARGLTDAFGPIGEAFRVGAEGFGEFLRVGGEIVGLFAGGVFTALSDPTFGAGLSTFMEGLKAGVEQMVPLMPHLTAAFGGLLTALAPIVAELGPSLVEVFSAFGTIIGTVLSIFQPLLVALADSPVILGLLIGAFTATAAASAALTMAGNVQKIMWGAWAVAAGIVNGILTVMRGKWIATTAAAVVSAAQTAYVWALYKLEALKGAAAMAVSFARVIGGWVLMGAQSLIQGARMAAAWVLAMGPIGWIITAVVALAALVIANWEQISAFTISIWSSISKWFAGFWDGLRLWFAGVIVGITKWFMDTWNNTTAGWTTMWSGVGQWFTNFWNGLVAWFSGVITAVTKWFVDTWNATLATFRAIWDGVSKWFAQFWTNLTIWFKETIAGIGRFFSEAWTNIANFFKDTWNGLLGFFVDIWEDKLKPAFEAFGNFIKKSVAPAFQKGVDAIKTIWDKVKDIAAKPVQFMVDTVYMKGIRPLVNGIIDGLGLPQEWLLPEMEFKGFATGGYTGPGGKYEEAGVVHRDEFVLRKEATNKLRKTVGLDGLNYMNQTGMMPGYFTGGLVTPVQGPLTSRFGEPRGKYPHAGVDYAVPVGTIVRSALDGIIERVGTNIVTGRTGKGMLVGHDDGMKTYYGHLSAFIAAVGQKVRAGEGIAKSGNTGNSTGPHLHFETWKNGKAVDPLTGKGGLDTGGGGGQTGRVGNLNPLAPIFNFANRLAGKFKAEFPDGGKFVDMMAGTGKVMLDRIIGKFTGFLGGIGDFVSPTQGGIFDKNKGSKDQVKSVAKGYGWDQGEMWNALHEIVNRESSWRLDAANPSSSARGLFQKMTSIHGAVEGTAGDQAGWGLNYIRERYGNPMNALMHHNQKGWYADGGLVTGPEALLRDKGGNLPPGLSMVLNKTGRDEMVLTDRQWRDISTLAVRGADVTMPDHLVIQDSDGTFLGRMEVVAGDVVRMDRRRQNMNARRGVKVGG